jgi:hypothetical protein
MRYWNSVFLICYFEVVSKKIDIRNPQNETVCLETLLAPRFEEALLDHVTEWTDNRRFR